jgi:flavin reductase (DIM6/NTAB) family NADH-FMN oxidoreductase RutF
MKNQKSDNRKNDSIRAKKLPLQSLSRSNFGRTGGQIGIFEKWKPGTLIYPLPAVMISCGETEEEYNIITVSWVGTICTNPPMCYISVRPERHSYEIIKRAGEFVINLTNEELARATDWCGVRSGKDYNKFKEMKLTPVKADAVNAPIIAEAPLCIECKVKEIIPLGSHDMFISEVVNVQADTRYIDKKTDKFDLEKAKLIAYSHGHYYKLGEEIGRFGWTVRKK